MRTVIINPEISGIYLFLLILSGYSCTGGNDVSTEKTNQTDSRLPVITGDTLMYDTANAAIYNFMRELIDIYSLDRSYGLQIEAESTIDPGGNDIEFLNNLIAPENSENIEKSNEMRIRDALPVSCRPELDEADIKYMLKQKDDHKGFKWDNDVLGFNLENEKHWYSFSVPVFNKSGTIVIISIYDLCPGLCGSGELLIFTKMNNRWDRCREKMWMH